MSWSPCPDPVPGDRASAEAIEMLIIPRAVDLGEMQVRRALPSVKRQMVGPFIFFDQMGPAEFLTDQGIDVRPHPHINLATVTYLFEGQILHRDSLGTEKTIEPGAVNWMRAGRGIVHSERTSSERRRTGQRLFGTLRHRAGRHGGVHSIARHAGEAPASDRRRFLSVEDDDVRSSARLL
jgi:redox-sensitive bicupin YhaK (pirin superfamily)